MLFRTAVCEPTGRTGTPVPSETQRRSSPQDRGCPGRTEGQGGCTFLLGREPRNLSPRLGQGSWRRWVGVSAPGDTRESRGRSRALHRGSIPSASRGAPDTETGLCVSCLSAGGVRFTAWPLVWDSLCSSPTAPGPPARCRGRVSAPSPSIQMTGLERNSCPPPSPSFPSSFVPGSAVRG